MAMGLLELPDLRHTLVDIGTTVSCVLVGITDYLAETVRRAERVGNTALSSAASYEIPGQVMERALVRMFSR